MDIAEIQKVAGSLAKAYGVPKVYLFGSYARGDQTATSDVDLKIDVRGTSFGLLELIGLKEDLEKKLNKKVDLVTEGGVYHRIAQKIGEEEIVIYEQN